MKRRRLRNWAIGFLIAAAMYSVIAYFVIDYIADQFLDVFSRQNGVITQTEKHDHPNQQQIVIDDNQVEQEKKATNSNKVLTDAKQNLTFQEKWTITSILREKFTQTELDQFLALAEDGLTNPEKKQLRTIFLGSMSEQEYNELIAIAAKYGLSEGRTYDQHKK